MAATNLQVTCITKRGDHYDPHERIKGIGGTANGVRWWYSEDDAILNIESGRHGYFVHIGTHSVWVIVVLHLGRKYLKTTADGYRPDNLLSLPECPPR